MSGLVKVSHLIRGLYSYSRLSFSCNTQAGAADRYICKVSLNSLGNCLQWHSNLHIISTENADITACSYVTLHFVSRFH